MGSQYLQMLYVSPHNSAVAQSNLFSSLQCQTLIIGEPLPSLVATLLATVGLRILEAPSVFELTKPHRVFPFEKAFEDIRFEPLVALYVWSPPKSCQIDLIVGIHLVLLGFQNLSSGRMSLRRLTLHKLASSLPLGLEARMPSSRRSGFF